VYAGAKILEDMRMDDGDKIRVGPYRFDLVETRDGRRMAMFVGDDGQAVILRGPEPLSTVEDNGRWRRLTRWRRRQHQ
jgi:hypothetical protein